MQGGWARKPVVGFIGMSDPCVTVRVEKAWAVVTLARPQALNALSTEMFLEIERAVQSLVGNPSIRALIFTGAGEKAFVSGADIAQIAKASTEQARAFSELGHRIFRLIDNLSVPTFAAVNGFALGGGCELALSCDLIFASTRAVFGFPEVGLGVIPGFGGTQRLARLIGRGQAKALVLTGDRIDANRAKQIGLVLEVLPADDLLKHCEEVAERIASKGPLAIAQAKRVINAGVDSGLAMGLELECQAFAALFGSVDQQEGMQAFFEKRSPIFQGK